MHVPHLKTYSHDVQVYTSNIMLVISFYFTLLELHATNTGVKRPGYEVSSVAVHTMLAQSEDAVA